MFLSAAVLKVLKASCGTTCSGVGAAGGFPGSAAGQTEAQALPEGPEAPASFEQVGAEKAVQAGRPEASEVQEEELNLSVLPMVCFGFQESVFQQTPGHGSAGR